VMLNFSRPVQFLPLSLECAAELGMDILAQLEMSRPAVELARNTKRDSSI